MGNKATLEHLSYQGNYRVENRCEYIAKDILNPIKLRKETKKEAIKAILWLLSKSPHSLEEIADHFDLSPQLINKLLNELVKANLVVKSNNDSSRFETLKINH